MKTTTTSHLENFSSQELREAGEILTAMASGGLPRDFYDCGIALEINLHSREVYLTNDEYHTAVMDSGRLKMLYTCRECGYEGFHASFLCDRMCVMHV